MPDLTIETYWTCETNHNWVLEVPGSKGHSYVVAFGFRLLGPCMYDYTCTCPSFEFRGRCKHIEANRGKRCGWSWQVGGGEVDSANPKCPRCGGPVVAENHPRQF